MTTSLETAQDLMATWLRKNAMPCYVANEEDLEPATDELTISKIGGTAVWPAELPWPVATDTQTPLQMVCQINLADLAGLTTVVALEDLPSTGWLQFFCMANDVLGLVWDDAGARQNYQVQDQWRLVYHPEMPAEILEDQPEMDPEEMPAVKVDPGMCVPLAFARGTSYDFTSDKAYEAAAKIKEQLGLEPDEDITPEDDDALMDAMDTMAAVQIGGHPDLCQEDMRLTGGPQLTLINLGSVWPHMFWGDAGSAHIFTASYADFNDVAYDWACA